MPICLAWQWTSSAISEFKRQPNITVLATLPKKIKNTRNSILGMKIWNTHSQIGKETSIVRTRSSHFLLISTMFSFQGLLFTSLLTGLKNWLKYNFRKGEESNYLCFSEQPPSSAISLQRSAFLISMGFLEFLCLFETCTSKWEQK